MSGKINLNNESIHALFKKASSYMRTITDRLDQESLLYFYARYKQAVEGPCKIPKPGFFDFQGKQKWEVWKNLGDKTKEEAMLEYIKELAKLEPHWEQLAKDTGVHDGLGQTVSTLYHSDEEICDEHKTPFDWCVDGDVDQMTDLLERSPDCVNEQDDQGMTLLHWASDRGFNEMVKLLIKHKADLNIQDSEGQTPLHYAVSCEHIPVIQTLVSSGASCSTSDSAGQLPKDLTSDPKILSILSINDS